MSCL
jgi:hypothetical protein